VPIILIAKSCSFSVILISLFGFAAKHSYLTFSHASTIALGIG